jgi:hypothetical protein
MSIVIMLSVILSYLILRVIMQCVIKVSVIMLSVVTRLKQTLQLILRRRNYRDKKFYSTGRNRCKFVHTSSVL